MSFEDFLRSEKLKLELDELEHKLQELPKQEGVTVTLDRHEHKVRITAGERRYVHDFTDSLREINNGSNDTGYWQGEILRRVGRRLEERQAEVGRRNEGMGRESEREGADFGQSAELARLNNGLTSKAGVFRFRLESERDRGDADRGRGNARGDEYTPSQTQNPYARSTSNQIQPRTDPLKTERKTYLCVPYEEKERAKKAGAHWEQTAKAWYAPKDTEIWKISEWLPENQKIDLPTVSTTGDPLLAFEAELERRGFELKSGIVSNDRIQRVHIEGDRSGTRNGAYRVFLDDGIPTLWLKDWKGASETIKHKDSHYNTPLSDKALEQKKEIDRIKTLQKSHDRERMHYAVSSRLAQEYKTLSSAKEHPYTTAKGVSPLNVKVDKDGSLFIAFRNTNDEVRTVQRIPSVPLEGRFAKYFEKNGEKTGNFAIVGAETFSELKMQKCVYITEGYATAVTLHDVTQKPVIVAGDSGNLKEVLLNIAKTLPKDTHLIIAADNDQLVSKPISNPGVTKALEAANAAKELNEHIRIIKPVFSQDEAKKGSTDFNDLQQLHGKTVVLRQIQQQIQDREISKKPFKPKIKKTEICIER